MIGCGMKWVEEMSLSSLNRSFWEVRLSRSPGRDGLGHDAQINAKGVLGPSNQGSKAEGGTGGVRSLRVWKGKFRRSKGNNPVEGVSSFLTRFEVVEFNYFHFRRKDSWSNNVGKYSSHISFVLNDFLSSLQLSQERFPKLPVTVAGTLPVNSS